MVSAIFARKGVLNVHVQPNLRWDGIEYLTMGGEGRGGGGRSAEGEWTGGGGRGESDNCFREGGQRLTCCKVGNKLSSSLTTSDTEFEEPVSDAE